MTFIADPLQFDRPAPPATITAREYEAYLETLNPTGADLTLIEGMARGIGIQKAAAQIRLTLQDAVQRYFALTKPIASYGQRGRVVAIDGQTMLIEILRGRA